MAHAARLNLRMQKELKMLLTDPPPNATFPCLSEKEHFLTTIDVRLKGPEGTAYADGEFDLNIQIPERYPFQPPMVKFTTPVYHPNIDNGGRICLDILNLPPKGSWQPSLNISTVITSIGLLLSEPNPDDGLMHEASKEYKYNNQAFEHKARAMTEKYAKAGKAESSTKGGSGSETVTQPISEHIETMESSVSSKSENEHSIFPKRLHGISRKLSLDSLGSNSKTERGNDISVSPTVPDNDVIRKPRKQLKLFNTAAKKISPSKTPCEVSNLLASAANSADDDLKKPCKDSSSSIIPSDEALIVLDSDESDDGEDAMKPGRSKLSLRQRRKCLSRMS